MAVPLLSAMLLLGCGGATGGADGEGVTGDRRVTVLAASSLVDVVADLAAAWDQAPVDVVDAGSQVLAAQVRAGAPVDLVLLADAGIARALADDGLLTDPELVATNSLVVAVPASTSVTTLDVLEAPGARVVLADEGVPLGDATRRALTTDPSLDALAVLDGVDSFEDAARSVLAKVASGEADAAVVYATDARAAGDDVRLVPWAVGAEVVTPVTLQRAIDARGLATDLAAFVADHAQDELWLDRGFVVP